VISTLLGSFAVPGPVVVFRWRSQLLLSYAVHLSTHATSTGGVIFYVSLVDDSNHYFSTQVKDETLHVSSGLLVPIVDYHTTTSVARLMLDAILR
jgi:hypothetical protein